jgi:hypothetical protein
MIKIGDRVKFLNDVGGGIVTGFLGKNMVKVENEDGFEVPYPVAKLINVDDPALNKDEIRLPNPLLNLFSHQFRLKSQKVKNWKEKIRPIFISVLYRQMQKIRWLVISN